MNAQIIRGQSYEAYAASKGLRASQWKRFLDGPEVFEEEVLFGAEDEDGEAESKSKAFGRLCHSVLLEGASFSAEPEGFHWIKGDLRTIPKDALVECPEDILSNGNFLSKKAKEFKAAAEAEGKLACNPYNYNRLMLWHQWKEENASDFQVSQADADALRRIRDRIMRDPRAKALIFPDREGAETEISLYWEADGVEKKARIDRLFPALFVDLKTARCSLAGSWVADAWKYRYDMAAVWYQEGIKACFGVDLPVEFVVVENQRPWRVRVHQMPESWLHSTREEMREKLIYFRQCRASGVWEAEDAHVIGKLQPPRWAKYQREYDHGE